MPTPGKDNLSKESRTSFEHCCFPVKPPSMSLDTRRAKQMEYLGHQFPSGSSKVEKQIPIVYIRFTGVVL